MGNLSSDEPFIPRRDIIQDIQLIFFQRKVWLNINVSKIMDMTLKKTMMRTVEMNEGSHFDVKFLVVGTGPGGDAVANRLAQLGARDVVIVEQGPIGGVCVNRGCIPTHFALENLLARQQMTEMNLRHRLFTRIPEIDFNALKLGMKKISETLRSSMIENYERSGIELINGTARIVTPNKVEITKPDGTVIVKTAETIIVASGATFTDLEVAGADAVKQHLIRADRVMVTDFDAIPQSISVYGLDSPALELAVFFHLLGSDVTLLCPQKSVISYGSAQLSDTVEEYTELHGIEIYKEVQLKQFVKAKERLIVEFSDKEKDNHRLECEFFVNAFRRQSNLGCVRDLPIKVEENRPLVSETLQSSIQNIYFLGDVRSGNNIPFRSHLAAFSGKLLADSLMGRSENNKVDLKLIPRGTTTIDFQVAKIGLTEQEARKEGFQVKTLQIPNSYNAYAHILGQIAGYVMLVVETRTGRILGGEIASPEAINLITIIGTAIASEATIYDLRKIPGFHPSLAEEIIDCAWSE